MTERGKTAWTEAFHHTVRRQTIYEWLVLPCFLVGLLAAALLREQWPLAGAAFILLTVVPIGILNWLMVKNWRCPRCADSLRFFFGGTNRYCGRCGKENAMGRLRCSHGRHRTTSMFGLRFCPKCGVRLAEDAEDCQSC